MVFETFGPEQGAMSVGIDSDDFNEETFAHLWTDSDSAQDGKCSMASSPVSLSWRKKNEYNYDVDSVATQLLAHAKKAYGESYPLNYDSDSSSGNASYRKGNSSDLSPRQGTGPKKSGPRKLGEGCEEMHQGITSVKELPGGGVEMRITLLAAGFVIGSGGVSVHQIIQKTGATVQSWSEKAVPGRRACRAFRVLGKREKIAHAVEIIQSAVQRYKDLCEGKSEGIYVQRQQYVHGVEFCYQPPPKSKCPTAALLGKDRNGRSGSRRRPKARGHEGSRSAATNLRQCTDTWTCAEMPSSGDSTGYVGCGVSPSLAIEETSGKFHPSLSEASLNVLERRSMVENTSIDKGVRGFGAVPAWDSLHIQALPKTKHENLTQDTMVREFQHFSFLESACNEGVQTSWGTDGLFSTKSTSVERESSRDRPLLDLRPCCIESGEGWMELLPRLRC